MGAPAVKTLMLREPQHPMVDWLAANKRCALWAGMGIGKTPAVLFTLDMLRLLGDIDPQNPTLVIGPARVARDTWPDEVAKWEQFKDFRIMPLTGCTPEERFVRMHTPADIYTISYELTPWLVEYWLAKWPYKQVIADEADRLKGFREKSKHGTKLESKKAGKSGKRAHQLGRIAHNLVDRWINLSGTPATAGLKDLWGQTWYLDRGARLGRTHSAFQRRWFRKSWDSDYGFEPMPFAEQQIHAALHDICLTVDPKDYFDLKDPIHHTLVVKLPPKARKIYKELEREMYVRLEELGKEINAVSAAALMTKCLQLANGCVYTNKERTEWANVHDEKLEALDSIIHEAASAPVMVGVSFRTDKMRILKAFRGAVDLATTKGLAAFKAGKATVGVAHPASMGHGIDGLQYVCNIIAFFGHTVKTGERLQLIERVGAMRQFQAGLERPVYLYDIVAEDTEDERVMEIHSGNTDVLTSLLNAMKRRKSA